MIFVITFQYKLLSFVKGYR